MIYVNARFLTQPLTGVQRYAFEVCIQMKKLNSDIVFLSPKNIKQHDWAQKLGATIIGFQIGHRWEQIDLPLYLNIKKEVRLFSPCNTGPIFIKNQFVTIHDLAFLHGYHSTIFSRWYKWLIPILCKRATHLFTVSETVKGELIKNYKINSTTISITYNGLGEEMKKYHMPIVPKENIILSVGSISKRKNSRLLIDAFLTSKLAKTHRLVLIGNQHSMYPMEELPKNELVTIIENATDKEIITYYQKASIAVYLSSYEGFGIPILESLAFGCILLCSDIAVNKELFTDYVEFCSLKDYDDIIQKMNSIASKEAINTNDLNLLLNKYNFTTSAKHILAKLTA
jgi:glycosyltransferase involved in cell wall biosynthesis